MNPMRRQSAAPEPSMTIDLPALTSWNHAEAFQSREALLFELLKGAGSDLFGKTSCLTLLAGAGTRWRQSLLAAIAASEPRAAQFPLDAPRGLFPVRNFLGGSQSQIAMAAYAVAAFHGLGRQTIVVRGWEAEIRKEILTPLGISGNDVNFRTQEPDPSGKVRGHGDATRQALEDWKDSEYVLVNFGGDASSPLSALLGLLALARLEGLGEGVDLLLPVASIRKPAYPIELDSEGLPRAFGHNKLGPTSAWSGTSPSLHEKTYTNVGIRAYRTSALAAVIADVVDRHWSEKSGYSIPGNDPKAGEFALDNIDAIIARKGRARILATAIPEELTPAKSYDEVERFEDAIGVVREDWRRLAETLESHYPANPWTKQHFKGSGSEDRP